MIQSPKKEKRQSSFNQLYFQILASIGASGGTASFEKKIDNISTFLLRYLMTYVYPFIKPPKIKHLTLQNVLENGPN